MGDNEQVEAIEVVADSAPVVDSSAESSDSGRMSMAEAFAAAKAELAVEETQGDSKPESSSAPEPPAVVPAEEPTADVRPPEAEKPTKPVTDQGVLDRIRTFVEQGREGELDPAARGVLNRIRNKVVEEQRQEESFRKTYLELEQMRQYEPDEFAEKVLENPGIVEFMRGFKARYPDISLENPTLQPRQPTRDEIVAEVDDAYRIGFEQMVDALASDAGLAADAVAQIKSETGGRIGAMLARTFTSALDTAVKATLAKELPRIQAAEREAAEKAAQAQYANKTIVTPREVNGLPVTGRVSSGTHTWKQALEEAKAEIANTR